MNFKDIIIILLLVIPISNVKAQELIPIEDEEVLKSYNQILIQKYPHVFDTMLVSQVYDVGNDHVQVEYILDGTKYEELIYQKDGKMIIVGTSMELPVASFPEVVMDAYKKDNKAKILSVYEFQSKYGEMLYVVEDINKKRYYFDNLGVKVKAPL